MFVTAMDDLVHPLIAPMIERSEPRGARAWRLRAAGLDPRECFAYFPTKRSAAEWVRDHSARWLAHALSCAERVGLVVLAPGPVPACGRFEFEPLHLDRSWPACGEPIHEIRQNRENLLARHRLGWPEEKVVAALLGRTSFEDEDKLRRAYARACDDLRSGLVSPEEREVLGATALTSVYLLLSPDALDQLGRRLFQDAEQRIWVGERYVGLEVACEAPTCGAFS